MVVITGCIGSDKTTCLQNLVCDLNSNNDWIIADASYVALASEQHNDKVMIVWDDCGEKYYSNNVDWQKTKRQIHQLIQWIEHGENKKFLLSISSSKYKVFNYVLNTRDLHIIKSITVNINQKTDAFTRKFEETILEQHCKCRSCNCNIQWNEVVKSISKPHRSSKFDQIGFPLAMRLLAIPDVARDHQSFLKDPILTVVKVFEKLREENIKTYTTLCCVLLMKGSLDINQGDIEIGDFISPCLERSDEGLSETTDEGEREKLNTQLNSWANAVPQYLTNNGSSSFRFANDLIFVSFFLHFVTCNPLIALQFCDLELLLELLRPYDHMWTQYENEDFYSLFGNMPIESISSDEHKDKVRDFKLPQSYYHILIQRIGKESASHNNSNNPWFKNKIFMKMLKEEKSDMK